MDATVAASGRRTTTTPTTLRRAARTASVAMPPASVHFWIISDGSLTLSGGMLVSMPQGVPVVPMAMGMRKFWTIPPLAVSRLSNSRRAPPLTSSTMGASWLSTAATGLPSTLRSWKAAQAPRWEMSEIRPVSKGRTLPSRSEMRSSGRLLPTTPTTRRSTMTGATSETIWTVLSPTLAVYGSVITGLREVFART